MAELAYTAHSPLPLVQAVLAHNNDEQASGPALPGTAPAPAGHERDRHLLTYRGILRSHAQQAAREGWNVLSSLGDHPRKSKLSAN